MRGKLKTISTFLILVLLFNIFVPTMKVIAIEYGSGTFGLTVDVDASQLTNGTLDSVKVNNEDWNNNSDKYLTTTGSNTIVIVATAEDGYEIGMRKGGDSSANISAPIVNGNTYTFTVTYNTNNANDNLSLYPYSYENNDGNPNDNNPPPPNNDYPDDIQIKGTYKSDGLGMHITFNGVEVGNGDELKNIVGTAKGYATGSEKNIIKIQLEFGEGNLGSVLINGQEMPLPEDVGDCAEFEVAPASEYIIDVTKSEDRSNVPCTIIWTNPDYKPIDEEDAKWVSDFKIEHGYAKVIAVYDETGKKLSPEEYRGEDADEFGLDNGFGWVKVFPKYKVVFEFVPEYGYQLTEIKLNEQPMVASEEMNFFTVTIPEGGANIHFNAVFSETKDIVTASSEKVSGGSIKLGNTLDGGSAQLTVSDVELSSDKIKGFENAAGEYTISNYLDIDLYNVYYKGKNDSEDVWLDKISELENEATISIKLEEGVNADDIVIVHNINDGEEYEVIEIESYDPTTNTITFKTKSFSNYAIATKTASTTVDTENTTSSNPTTGDNIILFIALFVIATLGTAITIKLNKNRKVRKH